MLANLSACKLSLVCVPSDGPRRRYSSSSFRYYVAIRPIAMVMLIGTAQSTVLIHLAHRWYLERVQQAVDKARSECKQAQVISSTADIVLHRRLLII